MRVADELLELLAIDTAALAWQRDALCGEPHYRDLPFFIGRGESAEPAKRLCRRCLVRDECLAFALGEHIEHGVWGGKSERERRALRSGREAPKPGRRRPRPLCVGCGGRLPLGRESSHCIDCAAAA